MSILLKNCSIVDVESSKNRDKSDILIQKGHIQSFNAGSADEVIDLDGKTVTPGWFDLNANFNDPGREFKEDLKTGITGAIAGGFTDVQVIADTYPPIETKAEVEYIVNRSRDGINLHVSAALSEQLKGENLTEILDLAAAGATSFSDGDSPVWNSELLLKALQYTSGHGIRVFQNPRDPHLSANTHMNEGISSTNLGLRGEPNLSEVLTIKRDLDILRYAGGRLHFSKISSKEAVELIQEGKNEGLDITADVAIHHLIFTDNSIKDFDSNYKTVPPFRTSQDRLALIDAVKSGVIDAICSNHRPQDLESKQLEFDLAEPGAISQQTFYSNLLSLTEQIPFETLVERVTNGPRKVLGMSQSIISEGMPAKLTVLDPERKWVLDQSSNLSKSRNSPFWDQELVGKVVGTINGTHCNWIS